MSLKVFIIFPELDWDSAEDFKNFVLEVETVVSETIIRGENQVFYDAENIESFVEYATTFLVDLPVSLEPRFRRILYRCSNWKVKPQSCRDKFYFHWKMTATELLEQPNLLAEIAERKLKYSDNSFLLLHLGEPKALFENPIPIIKDGYKDVSLPCFIKIDYESSFSEFIEWKNRIEGESRFTLKDNPAFEKTSHVWGKQKIYKEKATGNYWYFDYYHKDNKIHYEVFDSTGKEHLGEANENGILDTTKASPSKKIDKLISGN